MTPIGYGIFIKVRQRECTSNIRVITMEKPNRYSSIYIRLAKKKCLKTIQNKEPSLNTFSKIFKKFSKIGVGFSSN